MAAYAPALVVLLIGFAMSGAVASWFFNEAKEVDSERFEGAVKRFLNELDERTRRYDLELQRFTDRIAALRTISQEAWLIELDRLGPKGKLPALVELAVAKNPGLMPFSEVEDLAAHPQTNRIGHFVLPRIALGTQEVIQHWTFNSSVSEADTRAWLMQPEVKYRWTGILNGKMASSPRRILKDTSGTEFLAVSLFFPIFEPDVVVLAGKHPKIRHTHFLDYRFKGMVIATISWETFLESALSGEIARIGFEAFGDTNITAASWMGRLGGAPSLVLNPEFKPRYFKKVEWSFFRKHWQLAFYSTPLFEGLSTTYRSWAALAGGSLISMLMAGLVGVQIRARRRQESISGRLRGALSDLSAARQERERLNHDLHDGTIQSLYALQLGISRCIEMASGVSPAVSARLEEHRRALSGVIGELRGFILQHEADAVPATDLGGVLEALAQRLRLSTGQGLTTELSRKAALRLQGAQAVHLANLGREALSNALRHANASHVTVRLEEKARTAVLEISDDGIGFDPANVEKKGLGLVSMAARARQAGGILEIKSGPNRGTTIHVIVPLEEPSNPDL